MPKHGPSGSGPHSHAILKVLPIPFGSADELPLSQIRAMPQPHKFLHLIMWKP